MATQTEFISWAGGSFSTTVDARVAELHRLNDKLFDATVGNTDPDQSIVDKWMARADHLEAELTAAGIEF
jgi:hypothetical protein